MATKQDLDDWKITALAALGGSARLLSICKWVWNHHEADLRASGDLFYTWQYDICWAAHRLRKAKRLKPAELSPPGIWELTEAERSQ